MNKRVFVKKKDGFQVESLGVKNELLENLKEGNIDRIDLYNVYDIFNCTDEDLELLKNKVLSEPVTDDVYEDVNLEGKRYLATEFLPGQYDQRADSAEQCLMLLNNKAGVQIKSGRLLVFHGEINSFEKVREYLINPIETREKNLDTLVLEENIDIDPVPTYNGFIDKKVEELEAFLNEHGLAMTLEDLQHIQNYFRNEEKRDPKETEIKVLDTYWSDHCRHTTFETYLKDVKIECGELTENIQNAFEGYLNLRRELGRESKPLTLMDMATIGGRYLRKVGKLDDLEESEEINACSVEVDVDVDGITEKWLLMFKNETHNHPTEIEPFGGASTCVGGAIRDPLSGRAYVYQAMRITGAGDITEGVENTLPNKLPQEKISKGAAHGYSSYGNQIGLTTTFVKEIYHNGYKAKRMEVGAVVGAVKKEYVRRESPVPGDIVILIGGKTGRDGVGGATGSSKEHNETSLTKCSSEVQKGNAPVERRIQRLFRNPEVTKLIKKSNDFGAGGVSVAIGEIARGVEINLDTVPVKYLGLNGTELAISESQERMAVVVEAKDAQRFQELVKAENLESALVAVVTEEERLVVKYKDETLVDLSREFLDTNGVRQSQEVKVIPSSKENPFIKKSTLDIKEKVAEVLNDMNVSSQRGMVEMFDASIGRSTVLMPFGGKYQLTESEGSVQKLPTEGVTNTCSIMTYGYNPLVSEYSPYLGAQYAVIESLARIVAMGGSYKKARLSFQEYFERLGKDSTRWGKPFAALLGGIEAQLEFETPAIGGKDSMSGTFKDLDVPPTLISFAVTTENVKHIISPEFKKAGNEIYLIKSERLAGDVPNFVKIKQNFEMIESAIKAGKIESASTIKFGGIAEAVIKMSFGNKIGAKIEMTEGLFDLMPGDIIVESNEKLEFGVCIGETVEEKTVELAGEKFCIDSLIVTWEERYGKIYPYNVESSGEVIEKQFKTEELFKAKKLYDKPKVLVTVFPGTNCEYDTKKAFERAGAEVEIYVFNNLGVNEIKESIETLSEKMKTAQIFMIPGGFSAGDEPDGSGKFIANILQNPKIKNSMKEFLANDGLILGICNGFQALIKSGLLPYGDVDSVNENSPTLFRNDINRHISRVVSTKIVSNNSPWMSSFTVGETHNIPVSHGEGKFVVTKEFAEELFRNGQVITQYCDENGNITMDKEYNLNGSTYAIEGIVSKCGRILGKMGHSERYENGLLKNISGNKMQDLFSNGVNYFKK
ncbi:MAG: phosphoribosylformylglycinamidine synthase [Cetobacterium sp.]|uniref:phosphoribosylformylglycinamidine synthase n=1 Tax=unclassified Cetobacterium TaxID=2630983 RepID=UPI0006468743|nr:MULTISPECIES: phosphoribosylformylglycinamidine synthase [unclassified Cetobacterium]